MPPHIWPWGSPVAPLLEEVEGEEEVPRSNNPYQSLLVKLERDIPIPLLPLPVVLLPCLTHTPKASAVYGGVLQYLPGGQGMPTKPPHLLPWGSVASSSGGMHVLRPKTINRLVARSQVPTILDAIVTMSYEGGGDERWRDSFPTR